METNKPFSRAGYLLAFLLVALPLFDAATGVWPLRLSDERWRFGAVGTLSNITLVPLLGLFLAIGIAILADHRRVRRLVGWICAIFAVAMAAFAVLFILDFFQTRTLVRPQFQGAMTTATTTALVKDLLALITLTLLSRAAFAGPKVVVRKPQVVGREPGPTPLVPLTGQTRTE